MQLSSFVRKPFTVEAVEITTENIAEVAKFIGTLHDEDPTQPYIQVDQKKMPNVFKVYPGFWMTKMGSRVRCYSSHIFKAQFIEVTPSVKSFIEFLNEDSDALAG